MQYTSFTEVDRLEIDALKALLTAGEPPERVWAAWALGLRHHQAFARELRASAAEEPNAGVRRHLLVVLAGAGEARSVLTLAMHDPDERVRATALQYVARLASPQHDGANELLASTLASGTPLLRLGCIAGLRPDARPELWSAVDACVASPDRDLRWAAFEAVLRQGGSVRPAPVLARELLHLEPEQATRQNALRLLHERAGAEGLRQLLDDRTVKPGLLPEVVEALHTHGVRLEWAEVDDLITRFPETRWIHRTLQLLAAGGAARARAALLRLFVAGCLAPDHSRTSWEMAAEVRAQLRVALDENKAPLDESERRLREQLADYVEKAVSAARADPDFFDDVEAEVLAALPAQPMNPLSLSWFCEHEREILARLAPLEVH